MILTVYNEERRYRSGKQLGYETGWTLGMADGEALGRAEGEVLGRAEDLLIVLEGIGDVPSELRERILKEKDITVLKSWVKAAVQAKSIEEFSDML